MISTKKKPETSVPTVPPISWKCGNSSLAHFTDTPKKQPLKIRQMNVQLKSRNQHQMNLCVAVIICETYYLPRNMTSIKCKRQT